ncbi:MAG TPA: YIP1 family protein [Verrucomicrobiae bacterium]|jgi:hypothetical protein|nr:YIP1 family protein [Verrucomicrobiae bacterium]
MDSAPALPPPPEGLPSEPSSLTDRLAGIITSPGEVFEEIRNARVRASNWLVPLILVCIVTAVYMCVAMSQPPVLRDMRDQGHRAIEKKVAAGKVTQAQADQYEAMQEKFMTPTVVKFFWSIFAVLLSLTMFFILVTAMWLALKWFTSGWLGYMKMAEIYGLALVIYIPQEILRIWLVLWKQNLLATASPTLFLSNPSTSNKLDTFLSFFDVVDFWWLAVLALGVSKVASLSYRTAAFVVFGVWLTFRLVSMLLTPS